MRWVVAATLVVTVVAALVLALVMPRGLFQGDEGVKLAETQGLIESGFTDGALYHRGARYSGDHRYHPLAAAPGFTYTDPRTHKAYGTYPLLYPALAAPFYWIGGTFAIAGLSMIGLVISLVLTARLARRCLGSELAAAAAVAVVGLASPMLFYGGLVFEHTLGVAALLGAIELILDEAPSRRRLAIAGAVFGVATCFRTELYAFAPGLAVILVWRLGLRRAVWTRWIAFGLGTAAVIGVFLVVHRLATPFWHPTMAISQASTPTSFRLRFVHLVPRELYQHGVIAVLATLAAAVIVQVPGRARRPIGLMLTLAITIGWSLVTVEAIRMVDYQRIRQLTGLVTATPLVALAMVRAVDHRDRESPTAIVALAALLFLAVLVLLPKRAAYGGLELGARYMLPVVPLFVIAAIDHARRHWVHAVCAAALIGLSVWATVVNARAEYGIRRMGSNILVAIQQSQADAVFSQVWWVGQLAVPGQDQASLYVGGGATDLYDRLYDAGLVRVLSLRGGPPLASGRIKLRPVGTTKVVDPRISPQIFELYDPMAPAPPLSGVH